MLTTVGKNISNFGTKANQYCFPRPILFIALIYNYLLYPILLVEFYIFKYISVEIQFNYKQ